MSTENFENANRLRMKCQDLIVFAIEFFLIVFIIDNILSGVGMLCVLFHQSANP